MSTKHIVVVGDIIVDNHIYEGERAKPTARGERGVRVFKQSGGAAIISQLLDAARRRGKRRWRVKLGVRELKPENSPTAYHAFATWRPFPLDPKTNSNAADDGKKETGEKVWRAHLKLGYGEDGGSTRVARSVPRRRNGVPDPDVLVLDDGGFQFRLIGQEKSWFLPKGGHVPQWILLKMSDPVARGDLWHHLLDGGYLRKVLCLISAADLRREFVTLSSGLSWEQSVDDLRNAFAQSRLLSPLMRCRHLIVTLSTDCVLWLSQPDDRVPPLRPPQARLFFDADGAEGEWADRIGGEIVGSMTAMAAALAHALIDDPADPKLAPAIENGLRSMRHLMRYGHGPVAKDVKPAGYPIEEIAAIVARSDDKQNQFADVELDWWPRQQNERWSIAETKQRPLRSRLPPTTMGLARLVAVKGMRALKDLPHAKFGDLVAVDPPGNRDVAHHRTTDVRLPAGQIEDDAAGDRGVRPARRRKIVWREANCL